MAKPEGAIVGYIRVSTIDQDLSIQREALTAAGCTEIFEDKASGTKRDGRPGLAECMKYLRKGDTLVITKIDRLARSLKDLQDIVHELKAKGVTLRATESPVDTGSAMGKAFFDMLGVFAEFETNLRKERQLEGIAKAKREGVYQGRVHSVDPIEVRELRQQGIGKAEIARRLECARSSVCEALALPDPEARRVSKDVKARREAKLRKSTRRPTNALKPVNPKVRKSV